MIWLNVQQSDLKPPVCIELLLQMLQNLLQEKLPGECHVITIYIVLARQHLEVKICLYRSLSSILYPS